MIISKFINFRGKSVSADFADYANVDTTEKAS